jgi:hypothetical protein
MCHFISLVTDCPDVVQLTKTVAHLGRNCTPTNNPSIQRLLTPRERQFCTSGVCDCGTVLGAQEEPNVRDFTKAIEGKAKRGWSKAKIERWVADQQRADARPESRMDSHEFWARVVRDVLAADGTSSAGLIVHLYDGSIDAEVFAATRREVSLDEGLVAVLENMQPDELLIVLRQPK